MTEADLRCRVLKLAGSLGLLVQYSADPRRDTGKGYPDLTIADVRGCLFRELKNQGTMSPEQTRWRYTLVPGLSPARRRMCRSRQRTRSGLRP